MMLQIMIKLILKVSIIKAKKQILLTIQIKKLANFIKQYNIV